MTDDEQAARRRRLLYRSVRRGTKEADILIGGFVKEYIDKFDTRQLDELDQMLEQSDPDLMAWINGQDTPPTALNSSVLKMMLEFNKAK